MIAIEAASERFARALIPHSASAGAEDWTNMAREVVAATKTVLVQRGEHSNETTRHWLTQVSDDDLATLLSDTPAAGCFRGSHDTVAAIRTLIQHGQWGSV